MRLRGFVVVVPVVLLSCGLTGKPSPGPEPVSDGGTDAGSAAPDAGPAARKRLFVTSQAWAGNLRDLAGAADGLAGGDALCQGSAETAQVGGSWQAFLSSSTAPAEARITGDGPWFAMDGTGPVFADRAGLTGPALQPLMLSETNHPVPSAHFWVGDGSFTCSNWSAGGNNFYGGQGLTGVVQAPTWRNEQATGCAAAAHLLCLER